MEDLADPNSTAAERLWEVYTTDRVMSCEMTPHPLGWEIRSFLNGQFRSGHAFPTRDLAEAEASVRKRLHLDFGWTERPPIRQDIKNQPRAFAAHDPNVTR